MTGERKDDPTENIVGGAEIGALAGTLVSESRPETTAIQTLKEVGTGAAVGAGLGTVVTALTPAPKLTLPPESQMEFYLAAPISVIPVTQQEAARLSRLMPGGAPVVYVRGDIP